MKASLKRAAKILVDELLKSDNMMTEVVNFYGQVMCLFAAGQRKRDRENMFDRRRLTLSPAGASFKAARIKTKGKNIRRMLGRD